MVVAIDSTGLTIYNWREWNRHKHKKSDYKWQDKWRKLHICIDVLSGQILSSSYSDSNHHDCNELPGLIDHLDADISAVCADMAYDTVNCRDAVRRKKAKQVIPPKRNARLTCENRNLQKKKHILKERDQAINYIRNNKINGSDTMARALWKEKSGYHARSLVETTMSQIKAHCSDRITNRKEENRKNQAIIKYKVVNKIIIG